MLRRRHALIAAALLGLTSAAAAGVIAARRAETEVRLLFTGDILLSRQVAVERQRTGHSPWDSVASLFSRADWVAGNLEGAIGPDSTCVTSPDEACFAFDKDAPKLLEGAGFRAVTVENNHAADLGDVGRRWTTRTLAHSGVMPVSFEDSPRFVRVGPLMVALVAITTIPAVDGRTEAIPSIAVAQRLRLARELANVVIVSVHWGTELQDWPNDSQRSQAVWLVDHGADVVVGHHPHVVQPPQCIHGHPVFFSLGNHVFDQRYPETKLGLIADCRVNAERLTCGGIRTHARRGSAMPRVDGSLDDTALTTCSVATHPLMSVAGWTIAPEPWSASDSGGIALEGRRDGALRWRTRRVALASFAGWIKGGAGQPLLLMLERHRSPMDGEVGIRPHVYEIGDHGLIARWRGTALAWPLLDARVDDQGNVCALHRGDSFLEIDTSTTKTRTMRYRWNGFGFSAIVDPHGECTAVFRDER